MFLSTEIVIIAVIVLIFALVLTFLYLRKKWRLAKERQEKERLAVERMSKRAEMQRRMKRDDVSSRTEVKTKQELKPLSALSPEQIFKHDSLKAEEKSEQELSKKQLEVESKTQAKKTGILDDLTERRELEQGNREKSINQIAELERKLQSLQADLTRSESEKDKLEDRIKITQETQDRQALKKDKNSESGLQKISSSVASIINLVHHEIETDKNVLKRLSEDLKLVSVDNPDSGDYEEIAKICAGSLARLRDLENALHDKNAVGITIENAHNYFYENLPRLEKQTKSLEKNSDKLIGICGKLEDGKNELEKRLANLRKQNKALETALTEALNLKNTADDAKDIFLGLQKQDDDNIPKEIKIVFEAYEELLIKKQELEKIADDLYLKVSSTASVQNAYLELMDDAQKISSLADNMSSILRQNLTPALQNIQSRDDNALIKYSEREHIIGAANELTEICENCHSKSLLVSPNIRKREQNFIELNKDITSCKDLLKDYSGELAMLSKKFKQIPLRQINRLLALERGDMLTKSVDSDEVALMREKIAQMQDAMKSQRDEIHRLRESKGIEANTNIISQLMSKSQRTHAADPVAAPVVLESVNDKELLIKIREKEGAIKRLETTLENISLQAAKNQNKIDELNRKLKQREVDLDSTKSKHEIDKKRIEQLKQEFAQVARLRTDAEQKLTIIQKRQSFENDKKSELAFDLEDARQKISKLRKQRDEMSKNEQAQNSRLKILAKTEQALELSQEKISNLKAEVKQSQSKIRSLNDEIDEIREENSRLQNSQQQTKLVIDRKNQIIKDSEYKVKELIKDVIREQTQSQKVEERVEKLAQTLAETADTHTRERNDLLAKIEQSESQAQSYKDLVDELGEKRRYSEDERKKLQAKLREGGKLLEKISSNYQYNVASLKEKHSIIKTLSEKIERLESELGNASQRLEALPNIKQMQNEMQEQAQRIVELRDKLQKSQSKLSKFRESRESQDADYAANKSELDEFRRENDLLRERLQNIIIQNNDNLKQIDELERQSQRDRLEWRTKLRRYQNMLERRQNVADDLDDLVKSTRKPIKSKQEILAKKEDKPKISSKENEREFETEKPIITANKSEDELISSARAIFGEDFDKEFLGKKAEGESHKKESHKKEKPKIDKIQNQVPKQIAKEEVLPSGEKENPFTVFEEEKQKSKPQSKKDEKSLLFIPTHFSAEPEKEKASGEKLDSWLRKKDSDKYEQTANKDSSTKTFGDKYGLTAKATSSAKDVNFSFIRDSEIIRDDPLLGKIYLRRPHNFSDFNKFQNINAKIIARMHALGIYTYRQVVDLNQESTRNLQRLLQLDSDFLLKKWQLQARDLLIAQIPTNVNIIG